MEREKGIQEQKNRNDEANPTWRRRKEREDESKLDGQLQDGKTIKVKLLTKNYTMKTYGKVNV
jgi:hypothetical protein